MPTAKIKNINAKKMDDVIRAALREFAEKSYHEASFNHIIKAAGFGKGTMYYYFRSKDDLFMTILKGVEQGAREIFALKDDSEEPLCNTAETMNAKTYWLSLQNTAEKLFAFAKAQPLVFRFISTQILTQSQYVRLNTTPTPAQTLILKLEQGLRDLLIMGQSLSVIRSDLPLKLLEGLVWNSLRVVFGFVLEDSKTPNRKQTELVLDLMWRQLAQSPTINNELAPSEPLTHPTFALHAPF